MDDGSRPMDEDFCPICGAYWSCEHAQQLIDERERDRLWRLVEELFGDTERPSSIRLRPPSPAPTGGAGPFAWTFDPDLGNHA